MTSQHKERAASLPITLAVCIRHGVLGMAVTQDAQLITLARACLYHRRSTETKQAFGLRRIRRLVEMYCPTRLVVEPGSDARGWLAQQDTNIVSMTLDDAKTRLLPTGVDRSHGELYRALVSKYPIARAHVRVLDDNGKVAQSERWKTVLLLAAALALGADIATVQQ